MSRKVFAHGEAGDEPFLKNMTTAFYDVSVSPTEIEVGQPVTVTGTVKILETWPHTLEAPELAAIVPVVPGPVFVMKDRTINDQASVGSFFAEKGGIYQFKMTLLGQRAWEDGMSIRESRSVEPERSLGLVNGST